MMESCGCVYVGGYDPAEVNNQFTRTARKQHKCYECGCVIEPSQQYEVTKSLFQGRWFQYKTCPDCVSIRDVFFCDGYIYGKVREDIAEHICDLRGEISADCIAKLTPVARDWVCELVEEQWDEIEKDDK